MRSTTRTSKTTNPSAICLGTSVEAFAWVALPAPGIAPGVTPFSVVGISEVSVVELYRAAYEIARQRADEQHADRNYRRRTTLFMN